MNFTSMSSTSAPLPPSARFGIISNSSQVGGDENTNVSRLGSGVNPPWLHPVGEVSTNIDITAINTMASRLMRFLLIIGSLLCEIL
jgi:hypothetical protein